jgi:hypothetical protein
MREINQQNFYTGKKYCYEQAGAYRGGGRMGRDAPLLRKICWDLLWNAPLLLKFCLNNHENLDYNS